MEKDIVIRAEGLGKKYIIGHQAENERYTALRDVMARTVKGLARSAREMMRGQAIVPGDTLEEFWALKEIDFEIRRGEVVGIIGRNGAGKSTLLKILSRITEPTEGRVEIKGRVASLLEVGTGFHPELTGRENIYLNGAILGMTRAEIRRKFDEIVDFAGVEKFLDTPVKRYSSGMYVRLAFAVAAHLEPEILVIDEVLAVGDAEFQKKCLGKMGEVAGHGRTVLFVSHNMAMIGSLCETVIWIDQGKFRQHGPVGEVILAYSRGSEHSPAEVSYREQARAPGDDMARLLSGSICDHKGRQVLETKINEPATVQMEYQLLGNHKKRFIPNFHFYRADGSCAFTTSSAPSEYQAAGIYRAECCLPANLLNEGIYSVGLALSSFETGVQVHFYDKGALTFNVSDPIDGVPTRTGYNGSIPGSLRPLLEWSIDPLS